MSAMDASSIVGPDAPLLREPASEPDLSPLMAQSARGRMVLAPKWRVYFASQSHRPEWSHGECREMALPDARAPTVVEHIHDDAVGFDGRHGARFV